MENLNKKKNEKNMQLVSKKTHMKVLELIEGTAALSKVGDLDEKM